MSDRCKLYLNIDGTDDCVLVDLHDTVEGLAKSLGVPALRMQDGTLLGAHLKLKDVTTAPMSESNRLILTAEKRDGADQDVLVKEMHSMMFQEAQSFSISDANSTKGQRLCQAAGIDPNITVYTAQEYQPPPIESLELLPSRPFQWTSKSEAHHVREYGPYVKRLLGDALDDSVALETPSDRTHQDLLTSRQDVSFTVKGTTDVFVALQDYCTLGFPENGLRLCFELKKQIKEGEKGPRWQAHVELIAANMRSPTFRPIVVLTDLRATWSICWLDALQVCSSPVLSREQAVFMIKAVLRQPNQDTAAQGSHAQPDLLSAVLQRRALPAKGDLAGGVGARRARGLGESFSAASSVDDGPLANLMSLQGVMGDAAAEEELALDIKRQIAVDVGQWFGCL